MVLGSASELETIEKGDCNKVQRTACAAPPDTMESQGEW